MKRDWSRFAPLGLVFAGLAAFVAGCLLIIVPKWTIWVQLSLIGVVVGLGLYVALAPGQLRQAMKGRRVRYGFNAVLMSMSFFGILVVINYMVFYNAKMNPKQTRWDLTEDKSNTMATESVNALYALSGPVTALAYYAKPTRNASQDEVQQAESLLQQAETLLQQYVKNGRGKFSYKVIRDVDPIANPRAFRQAGITGDRQIMLKIGDRQELVSLVNEQELTTALVRLIAPNKRTVYFTTGSGEFSPNTSGNYSYSRLRNSLEDKNYEIKMVNLRIDGIPQDAKVVVIGGPKSPLTQDDVNLISKYLDSGGSLVVLEDPMLPSGGSAWPPDPLVDYLAKQWGIDLGNDVIVQISYNEVTYLAYTVRYNPHLITQKMGDYVPVFPLARSVRATSSVPTGVQTTELALTAPPNANCIPDCSWVSSDLESINAWINALSQNQAIESPKPTTQDQLGPVPLVVAAENSNTNARMVVFGNSVFALDLYSEAPGNQDLLINSIDWCARQENLINLTPKEPKSRTLSIPVRYANIIQNLICLGTIILLPGAVIFAGVVAWVIRRRRG